MYCEKKLPVFIWSRNIRRCRTRFKQSKFVRVKGVLTSSMALYPTLSIVRGLRILLGTFIIILYIFNFFLAETGVCLLFITFCRWISFFLVKNASFMLFWSTLPATNCSIFNAANRYNVGLSSHITSNISSTHLIQFDKVRN